MALWEVGMRRAFEERQRVECLRRMRCERSFGSSPVADGGSNAEHSRLEQERLSQLERERPLGSSHVSDGGGEVHQLDPGAQVNLNEGEVTQDRTSGVIRSSTEIDRQ
jgi:hypothetical protein